MSSLEAIDLIISSDEFLLKMSYLLEWLKTTLEINEEELKSIRNDLASDNIDFSLDGGHLRNSRMKDFYSIILRLMKTKGVEAADKVVRNLFSENCTLSIILNGGLPFFDDNLYHEMSRFYGNKPKKLKKFKVLDYMNNSNFHDYVAQGHSYTSNSKNSVGNSNWLVWQRCLYLSLSSSKFIEEKNLYGFLCSDFTSSSSTQYNEEQEYGFDEKFYELIRVRKFYNNAFNSAISITKS